MAWSLKNLKTGKWILCEQLSFWNPNKNTEDKFTVHSPQPQHIIQLGIYFYFLLLLQIKIQDF